MLQKQSVPINFSMGVDTKTDPFQVPLGRFFNLENSIFTVGGRFSKRNGYGYATALSEQASFLTTFNGNLTAIGQNVSAFSQGTNTWVEKGPIQPLELSTIPLIRSNLNQSSVDSAISSTNLICTVYIDQMPSNPTVPRYMYSIADATNGQNVIEPTQLVPTTGTINAAPRVFILRGYFIICFSTDNGHLQYIAISLINPAISKSATDLAPSIISGDKLAWDGIVVNNKLYFAYNSTSGGQSIKVSYLNYTLSSPPTPTTYSNAGRVTATVLSMCADTSSNNPIIYAAYYDSVSKNGFVIAVNPLLFKVISNPAQIITNEDVANLTSVAQNGVLSAYYEISNAYSYDAAIPTNFINTNTCTQSGTIGTETLVKRSVGLASKAVILDGLIYFLTAYQSPFQPTYFLLNSSGNILARLAYSNGGGYLIYNLPSITAMDNVLSMGYLIKDFITSQNTSKTESITKSGIYSQTGINLVNFTIGTSNIVPVEIAQSLHLTGGFEWQYDGYNTVEQNFFIWPDSIEATWSDTGGDIVANPPGWVSGQPSYIYQAVYRWTDNQGNAQFSAPSIPVQVTLAMNSSTTGSITLDIPTLRLTYKIASPVTISIYRWSIAQQLFYEVTSIQNPLVNDLTVDSVEYVDTLSDTEIVGNSLIYTTGGVVENIGAPSFVSQTLFDNRVWGIDAEDKNLLWNSKQVIEGTPVEFTDLFTSYIAPSTASQGSTGDMHCLAPMDDKLIIFKRDAMYYINGSGPDNTGANSTYSQPIFITATVGSVNQQSIVFTDVGLMFQSDKGIWLLERNGISVIYIGAAVEKFTKSAIVNSSVSVPGTTQVRFTMDSGITLMYDYFFQQWGTFTGVPAISSTLYKNAHTYLDKFGKIYQETPGLYLDGNNPVLLAFTTSWINLAGINGYQRIWEMQFLASYVSPHKMYYSIAFDHGNSSMETILVPDNQTGVYGSDDLYGQTSPFGGPGSLEPFRIQFEEQKCDSFQLSMREIYDPSFGQAAGQGFSMSNMNLVVGIKKGYRPFAASKSIG